MIKLVDKKVFRDFANICGTDIKCSTSSSRCGLVQVQCHRFVILCLLVGGTLPCVFRLRI
ncbi:hypothetical protein I7I48_10266 [Histoplasma ohiense]|nr:hypothetical protein I7I48_10266 [Histoplasma ohiense (nom. inval.)]